MQMQHDLVKASPWRSERQFTQSCVRLEVATVLEQHGRYQSAKSNNACASNTTTIVTLRGDAQVRENDFGHHEVVEWISCCHHKRATWYRQGTRNCHTS